MSGSVIGVVLAGGASRRMGEAKAEVLVDGITMAEHVTRALRRVCDQVVASGGPAAGLEVIPDEPRSDMRGPLAGVASVLRTLARPVLVVGVDQPWVREETLRQVVSRSAGMHTVVPVDGGARQVTCAVFEPSILDATGDSASVQQVLDRFEHQSVDRSEWATWGEDGRSWFSVDTPEDVGRGLARFGPPIA